MRTSPSAALPICVNTRELRETGELEFDPLQPLLRELVY